MTTETQVQDQAVEAQAVEAQATQETVTINGKEYPVADLSETAKNLLTVFRQWQEDRDASVQALSDARLEVAKNEAALRDLAREIADLVENPPAAEGEAANEAEAPAA